MTLNDIKPFIRLNNYITACGNMGDDFLEVLFFYEYYHIGTCSMHTVEVRPSDYGSKLFFQDFDNRFDRDDYDEGIETSDTWSDPEKDDIEANWSAQITWLGPSYDYPDWPTITTDEKYVFKSATRRFYSRILKVISEHDRMNNLD